MTRSSPHGWDVERERRLARQKALGIVPPETRMPPRNDGVKAWDEHSAEEKRVFTRLQSAFAGMLDHADRHLARLVAFLEQAGIRDNTLILVLSDNGASQEGGPLGFVNAMGPYNFRPEPIAEKLRRLDDIGGPDTHTNFPHGWAMASNTPLRRYKQNTHGGGIRDPFVMSWPKRIGAKGWTAPPIRPCLRSRADLARTGRHRCARRDGGLRANADRGRELCALDCGRRGPIESLAAIFRDVRASRPLARRLESGGLSSAGNAVRKRQMGAVPPRSGFLRSRRSRDEGARSTG